MPLCILNNREYETQPVKIGRKYTLPAKKSFRGLSFILTIIIYIYKYLYQKLTHLSARGFTDARICKNEQKH